MKKLVTIVMALLLTVAFAGCSKGKSFMKDSEILDVDKVTGTITVGIFNDDGKQTDTYELKFELDYKLAPITVTNFVNLVKDDHFIDMLFHRLESTGDGSAVIQGGGLVKGEDEDGKLILEEPESKKLNYTIKGEFSQNGWDKNKELSNKEGTIAMARLGNDSDSASDQFYINMGDNSASWDGSYAVFGRITDNDGFFSKCRNELVNDTGSIGSYTNVPNHDIKIVGITLSEDYNLGETRKIKK